MNARGLLNSSMAVGAGQQAMVDAALPIAQQDASTYNNQNQLNQNLSNEANRFNATTYNTQNQLNQNLSNAANKDNALINNQTEQFNAGLLSDFTKQIEAQKHAQNMAAIDTANKQNLVAQEGAIQKDLTGMDLGSREAIANLNNETSRVNTDANNATSRANTIDNNATSRANSADSNDTSRANAAASNAQSAANTAAQIASNSAIAGDKMLANFLSQQANAMNTIMADPNLSGAEKLNALQTISGMTNTSLISYTSFKDNGTIPALTITTDSSGNAAGIGPNGSQTTTIDNSALSSNNSLNSLLGNNSRANWVANG